MRLAEQAGRRFTEAVEAVWYGTVLAHSRPAQRQWRTTRQRINAPRGEAAAGARGAGLTGAELEQALMMLRVTHSDIVAVRVAG